MAIRYSFLNDYSEGAHEKILEAMQRQNRIQQMGYGMDETCQKAREAIEKYLNNPDSHVHFMVGGTQTNLTVIAAFLKPHQGVIAADTGHINAHESGAIEGTGHKVLSLPAVNGKICAEQIEAYVKRHYADENAEHTVQPGMVYLSHPTEVGTIYTKEELLAIRAVCDRFDMPLLVDGARLGCALTARDTDVSLRDLAALTDAFYIGGTKMGALFGEALVLRGDARNKDFRYILKQRGGMLAKGFLLGTQFLTLFTDELYFRLAEHANQMAQRLTRGLFLLGVPFLCKTPTNQVFPILPTEVLSALHEEFLYTYWEPVDAMHDAIRLCTSWATEPAMVDAFLNRLEQLLKN